MNLSRKLSVSLIALSLSVPLVLMARADNNAIPTSADADQATTSKLVYGLLSDSRYAYRPGQLNAATSADIFKRYLEALDSGKVYFTAQDIAKFSPYKDKLGAAIENGQLDPAFAIFALYKQRVNQRISYARGLLKQNIFDFSGNDRWYYDREDAAWAKDTAELDQIWRQSVRNDWLRLKLAGKKPDDIIKTLDKRYANNATAIAQLDGTDAFSSVLNAYTASIDPHTDYFDPRSADRFNESMSLSLEGIGARLQKQDEVTVIRELIPGGPAALSNKFHSGDRIVGVGQGTSGPMEDVVGWRTDDVVDKIKGKQGTQVRLDIVAPEASLDSQPKRVVLTRAKIRLEEQAAKSQVLKLPAANGDPERRIGVIKLEAFYQDFEGRRKNSNDYASATRDVAKLLQQFKAQNVNGVVLDLRNNGGGSLDEAIELTGLFIDKGPVVQVRESGGRVSVDADDKPASPGTARSRSSPTAVPPRRRRSSPARSRTTAAG